MRRLIFTMLAGAMVVPSAAQAQLGGRDRFSKSVEPNRTFQRFMPEGKDSVAVPEYFSPAERALAQVEAGQYRRGLYTAHGLPGDVPQVAMARGRALAVLGEVESALGALAKVETADTLLERGRILMSVGRLEEAGVVLGKGLGMAPEDVRLRFEVGNLAEARGDLDAARAAYAWFVRPEKNYLELWPVQQERLVTTAAEAVAVGRGLHRHATLEGKYRNNAPLNSTILSIFVRAYDVIDKGNPEAHLAAAEYLAGHDDPEQAVAELKQALRRNQSLPGAIEQLGLIFLDVFDFDQAEVAVATLRELDPKSVRADLLEARLLLRQRRANVAEPVLRKVLERQPRNVEAMGLLAGVFALGLQEERVREVLGEVEKIDADNATAYFEVAEQLGAMRQYPRSEAMYKVAIERAPWWTEPRNALGLLYTQSGDEVAARQVLEGARELDPFNLRTTNYLRLLDRLDGMDRVKSEHFEVRFDAKKDPIIGELMLEYMESVHRDLSAIFDHTPAVTTLIEVFPTHAQFSVRTTGTPWIGTVGASTGRVIAMVAPRDSADTLGSYNWAQVLRHEYAHTVTLSATENRIPHWMTEGLAVYAEKAPLQWGWVPLLYSAVMKDELFTMDRLTWGFVRPKKPTDRTLAYAQSFWMCRYLIDTYGKESMLRLLESFKRGRNEAEAFTEVISRTPEQFHEEFVRWARAEVAKWGYDKASVAKYDELREKGEKLIEKKDFPAAVEVWEQIRALRPVDALPRQRLAGLYLTPAVNDVAKARENLAALHAVEIKDNRYAKRLSRLSAQLEDWTAAVRYAREAVWISPYDMAAHKLLLEQAEKGGDAPLAEAQRKRLAALELLERKPTDGQ